MCLLTEELLMAFPLSVFPSQPGLGRSGKAAIKVLLRTVALGRSSQVEEGFSPHIQSEAGRLQRKR